MKNSLQSNTTFFDGEILVRDNDDIILVTMNYRLNIFGFPGSPQLANSTTSQNFGALDVQAAIQWLHANIAAFGGDPERITIFGQSAGSTLASAYTFANPTDTIVKGELGE
jgi:carboxylesterase type B